MSATILKNSPLLNIYGNVYDFVGSTAWHAREHGKVLDDLPCSRKNHKPCHKYWITSYFLIFLHSLVNNSNHQIKSKKTLLPHNTKSYRRLRIMYIRVTMRDMKKSYWSLTFYIWSYFCSMAIVCEACGRVSPAVTRRDPGTSLRLLGDLVRTRERKISDGIDRCSEFATHRHQVNSAQA